MFFILSKILAFVITPLIWILTLLLFGFFSMEERRKKMCLRWALIIALFFCNGFIFDESARLWEIPAKSYQDLKTYDYGIVLGGMSVNDDKLDRVQFFRGVDRLIQAIDLYKRGIIKKIIFTSGSGRISHPEMKEAALVKPYILKMGVLEEDLIIESESNNTRENALFTKKIIDEKKLQGSFLLITSAFHMRRSLACFKKVGIEAETYSTDRYAGPRKFQFDFLFIPNVSTMNDWNNILKELVGFITYKIMGYV